MTSVWQEWKWPDAQTRLSDEPFALLPIGAVEEHGPHLPLGTDIFTADYLSDLVMDAVPLVRLPTLPYGQVWSLSQFPGSLTISDATVKAFLVDLGRSLQDNSVRGLVMLSGHLGNLRAMQAATRELWDGYGFAALALCFPGLNTVYEKVSSRPRWHAPVMHADEIETSLALVCCGELVDMSRAVSDYPDVPEHFGASAMRWHELTTTGVFGDATAATLAKGEAAFEIFAHETIKVIEDWCTWVQRPHKN